MGNDMCIRLSEAKPAFVSILKPKDKNGDGAVCEPEMPEMGRADFEAFVYLARIDTLIKWGNNEIFKSQLDILSAFASQNKMELDAIENRTKVINGMVAWLGLGDTQVSDLSALKGLTNLERLYLEGTRVSDEAISDLQKALPSLEISR